MTETAAPEGFRGRLADWLDKPQVRNTIIGVIVFNAVILGIGDVGYAHGVGLGAADPCARPGLPVDLRDRDRAQADRAWARFFRSGWNLFDFVIVGIALARRRKACRFCAPCESCGCFASCRSCPRCAAWSKAS
jgi:hypothetical protein